MSMKTSGRLHRIKFRIRKTFKMSWQAIRQKPMNPIRFLGVKDSTQSRMLMADNGVGDDITGTIQHLFDKGKLGDSITITLEEMAQNVWDEFEDWDGWQY